MEEHPWLRFPDLNGGIHRLIIGSFPPNKFTIYPKLQVAGEDINFFYGSRANSFWDLFLNYYNIELNIYGAEKDFEQFKDYLIYSNWGITDIARVITRKENTALDSDLRIVSYNLEIIRDIFNNNPVEKVVFTSNWVKNQFNNNLVPRLELQKGIEYFTLISPSPSGLMSLDWARDLFPQEDGISNAQYRERYYSWLFDQL